VFKKIVLLMGILLIAIAAIWILGRFEASPFPIFLGLLGLVAIGVFLLSKKKKWMVSNK
jgi:LPXTG-motif cell wall-anchored protein